jgi:hypothetical protein
MVGGVVAQPRPAFELIGGFAYHSSHPPSRAIQRGFVKWCRVGTASIPCAVRHAANVQW